MALDVKFLTGSQEDYSALLKAELIEEKTFYYITDESNNSKKLYLGKQELTNQEVYDILGGTPVKLADGSTGIKIGAETYDSIVAYINKKTEGLVNDATITNKIDKVDGASENAIPVLNTDGSLKQVGNVTIDSESCIHAASLETVSGVIKAGTLDESRSYYIPIGTGYKDGQDSTNTLATQSYVTEQVASGAVQYLGTISSTDDFENINNTSISKGDYIRIAVSIEDLPVDDVTSTIKGFAGDLLIAEKDNPTYYVDGTNWSLIASHDTDTTYDAGGGLKLTQMGSANVFTIQDGGLTIDYLADDSVGNTQIRNNAVSEGKLDTALQTKINNINTIATKVNSKVNIDDNTTITEYVETQIENYDTNTLAKKYTNVIETIKVNDDALTPSNKAVNISIKKKEGVTGQLEVNGKDIILFSPSDYASSESFTILQTTVGTIQNTIDNETTGLEAAHDKAETAQSTADAAQTAAQNAQTRADTAHTKIGTQKTGSAEATGIYADIQGGTTATVADCVQAINKIYDGTTETEEIVSQIEHNVKGVYNTQQSLAQQLKWNEIMSLTITFNEEGNTNSDTIYYIGGQFWGDWVDEPFNKAELNISRTSVGSYIIKQVNSVTYYLTTENNTYVKATDIINDEAYDYKWYTSGTSDTPEDSGGNEGSGDNIVKTTIAASSLGLTNQETIGNLSPTDELTISHDKGDNENSPIYSTAGTAIRIYPGNTITFSVASPATAITEIVFDCTQGASLLTPDKGTYTSASATNGKWTGNASAVTFTNTSTEGGTAGQVRIVSYYVEYK